VCEILIIFSNVRGVTAAALCRQVAPRYRHHRWELSSRQVTTLELIPPRLSGSAILTPHVCEHPRILYAASIFLRIRTGTGSFRHTRCHLRREIGQSACLLERLEHTFNWLVFFLVYRHTCQGGKCIFIPRVTGISTTQNAYVLSTRTTNPCG
jgi:hypothetical protein